jgi:hypothetical protein
MNASFQIPDLEFLMDLRVSSVHIYEKVSIGMLFACMYVCMYGCAPEWLDGSIHIWYSGIYLS